MLSIPEVGVLDACESRQCSSESRSGVLTVSGNRPQSSLERMEREWKMRHYRYESVLNDGFVYFRVRKEGCRGGGERERVMRCTRQGLRVHVCVQQPQQPSLQVGFLVVLIESIEVDSDRCRSGGVCSGLWAPVVSSGSWRGGGRPRCRGRAAESTE